LSSTIVNKGWVELKGVPVTEFSAVGVAVPLDDINEISARTYNQDIIIINEYLNEKVYHALTELKCRGAVIDKSNFTCHVANLIREYLRINTYTPIGCIVSTGTGTRDIPKNARIQLDGNSGSVVFESTNLKNTSVFTSEVLTDEKKAVLCKIINGSLNICYRPQYRYSRLHFSLLKEGNEWAMSNIFARASSHVYLDDETRLWYWDAPPPEDIVNNLIKDISWSKKWIKETIVAYENTHKTLPLIVNMIQKNDISSTIEALHNMINLYDLRSRFQRFLGSVSMLIDRFDDFMGAYKISKHTYIDAFYNSPIVEAACNENIIIPTHKKEVKIDSSCAFALPNEWLIIKPIDRHRFERIEAVIRQRNAPLNEYLRYEELLPQLFQIKECKFYLGSCMRSCMSSIILQLCTFFDIKENDLKNMTKDEVLALCN
jgi:hypothetical protein